MERVPEHIATLARNIPCGSSKRIKHCCSESTMIISNTLKGVSCHCFKRSCGLHAFTPHDKQSIGDILKRHKEYTQSIKENKVLVLPDDYTLDVPLQHMPWYLSKGISDSLAVKHGIGFSEKLNRFVLPVYEDDVLTNVQLRAVGNETPKYLTPGANQYPNALFYGRHHSDYGIVVEDILSAIKLGQWRDTVSTLGTRCSSVRAYKISQSWNTAFIWYDNDKGGRAGAKEAMKNLSMQGVKCIRVNTEKDPKYYTKEEVKEILNRSLND